MAIMKVELDLIAGIVASYCNLNVIRCKVDNSQNTIKTS